MPPIHTRLLIAILAVLACLGARQAQAILVGAGSMESMLRRTDVVVKARVLSIERAPFERLAFTVQPLVSLKAGPKPLPPKLSLVPADPIWPRDLDLPYRKGVVALFFLQQTGASYEVVNNLRGILPAMETEGGPPAEGSLPLETRLFKELQPVLKAMKTDAGKSRMLNLMSEVAPKGSDEAFAAYLKDDNEWVRRGALSGLLRLNPTAERVEQANADFKAFLKTKPRGDLFRFWGLYRVIDTDNDAFLPLYRTILDDRNARPFEDAAVRGLRRGGQKEDALRLYRFTRHKSDYLRHEALDGLCRMFKIPLKRPEVTSYEGPLSQSAVEQERRMRVAVTKALQQEGLLKAKGKAKPANPTAAGSGARSVR